MWIDFNVNDYVRVKLTDRGRDSLRKQYYKLFRGRVEYEPPKEDQEGWSRWQLWELMSHFGGELYNGCELPFFTGIQFEVRNADQPSAATGE